MSVPIKPTSSPAQLTPEQQIKAQEIQLREANENGQLFEAVLDVLTCPDLGQASPEFRTFQTGSRVAFRERQLTRRRSNEEVEIFRGADRISTSPG